MAGPPRFKTEDEVGEYLWECVRIDPLVIQEEYVRLPSDLAYWNERYASAYRFWLEIKDRRERTEAQLAVTLRKDLELELAHNPHRTGKVTVGEVAGAVASSEEYRSVRAKEIGAEAEKVRLWGVLDAIRTKRDMLVSLGATQRAEMESGLGHTA